MVSLLLVVATLAVAVPTGHADDREIPGLLYVGTIELGCKNVVRARGTAATPAGFTVTPQEALTLVAEKVYFPCNSPLEQVVYADSKNYYLFDSILLTVKRDAWKYSVLVDGKSGVVTDNRTK